MTDDDTEYVRADLADLADPLGAVAMRDAAETAVTRAAWKHDGKDAYSTGMDAGARHQSEADIKAIRALPLPNASVRLRAALALPEVRALVEAANHSRLALAGYVSRQSAIDKLDTALAALKGTGE